MSIDERKGFVRWIPVGIYEEPVSVVLRATDSFGGFAIQEFDITVGNLNRAPLITSIPATLGFVGQLYKYGVKAVDPDGEVVLFSLESAPEGMIIDEQLGQIRWTPTQSQIGVQTVKIVATDPSGASVMQTYAIEVQNSGANNIPQILTIPNGPASVNANYRYQVKAIDLDNDPILYALSTSPRECRSTPRVALYLGYLYQTNWVSIKLSLLHPILKEHVHRSHSFFRCLLRIACR